MQADMENSVKPSAGQAAKRLFIALRFSAEEQDALAQSRDAVLERLRTGRPSPTANIHLTLAFLGMLDSTGEGRAAEALRSAARECGPVTLSLGALGAFERQRGGIVWRGVSRQEGLLVLQRTLVRELTVRGLSVDEKPWCAALGQQTTHLTCSSFARRSPACFPRSRRATRRWPSCGATTPRASGLPIRQSSLRRCAADMTVHQHKRESAKVNLQNSIG